MATKREEKGLFFIIIIFFPETRMRLSANDVPGIETDPVPAGHKLFIFDETGRHKALIFGMSLLLIDLYQVFFFSNDATRIKTDRAPGVTKMNKRTKKETINFFSETRLRRASIFNM